MCFASYGMMNKCLDIWENSDGNLLQKIENVKTIYREVCSNEMEKSKYIVAKKAEYVEYNNG